MLEGKSENESKKSKKDKIRSPREIAFKTAPHIIPLAFKLGLVYLGFKRKAKKAGKIFKKELISNGIDKNTAKLLTEEYLKTSHFLRGFDFSHMVKGKM